MGSHPRAVLSSDLEYSPRGGQSEMFADSPPRPAVDNILVAKMRGGQVSCSRFRRWSKAAPLIRFSACRKLWPSCIATRASARITPSGPRSVRSSLCPLLPRRPLTIIPAKRSYRILSPLAQHRNPLSDPERTATQVPSLLPLGRHFDQQGGRGRRRRRTARHGQSRGAAACRIRRKGPPRARAGSLYL
jgi:hypothetical protein